MGDAGFAMAISFNHKVAIKYFKSGRKEKPACRQAGAKDAKSDR